DIASASYKGQSDAARGAVGIGVGNPAFGPIRHPIVVGATPRALYVHGNIAFSHSQSDGPGSFFRRRGAQHLNRPTKPVLRYLGGNLVVQHIDYPANRAAAV